MIDLHFEHTLCNTILSHNGGLSVLKYNLTFLGLYETFKYYIILLM